MTSPHTKAAGKKRGGTTLGQILRKLDVIERKLEELDKKITPKRYMSFWEAIPPPTIVQRAVNALSVEGEYTAFSAILASYYNIHPPTYVVDTTKTMVPPDAIACYVHDTNQVFSKEARVTIPTAFHEFFHAMVASNVVIIPPNSEQEYADKFADACVKLAATTGIGGESL